MCIFLQYRNRFGLLLILELERMDIETLRQEREEKRRQRRERIRRILEDDGTTPSRSSRLEKSEASKESAPRSQRSSAARRARDETTSASPARETANEGISGSARSSEDSKISPRTAEDDGSTLSNLKAKRDARRRRNREHDLKQNNMKVFDHRCFFFKCPPYYILELLRAYTSRYTN